MSVPKSSDLPKIGQRVTHYLLLLFLIMTGLLIGLIQNGRFDPQPVGELQWEAAPVTAEIVADPQLIWLERPLPPPPYTIRLTVAWQSGHPDTAIGLALGDESDYIVTAVAPTGYFTPPTPNPHTMTSIPQLPWPHINQLDTPNEIWLDVTADSITIRLNRELYGQEAIHVPAAGQIGLWGMSWAETAVVTWQRLELFYDP